MTRSLGMSVALLAALVAGARAQGIKASVGVQGAFGDYREVDSSLAFRGKGVAGTATVSWRKLGADVEVTSLTYDPHGGGASQSFKSTQVDVHLRWYIAGQVSFETGFTKRTVDPEFTAQSMGAVRIGVRGLYNIGPGASLSLRGNYLAGSKFSGGGTAGFGVELGLGISVGRRDGRFRLTGDYGFQRVNRKTTSDVPIQQSLARLGVAVGF
jgi:hypothetical protein